MRFSWVEVEWFKGIRSARVEFGPGLNILFGPNDLGKSTLSTAIRAALLLPPTSSAADGFKSWFVDEKATVTLAFIDDTEMHWRVKKTFGGSGGSQLWHSKDGQTWTANVKGREVEEKLRTLLPWGIRSPGGKGAPKGLPESFLSNALLGEQGQVDGLLRSGLDGDDAESGRLALTKALSSLAQDPLFKKVLNLAQSEFDRYFTERGTRRGGKSSEITKASDQVKKLQSDREVLQKSCEQVETLTQLAGRQREERATLATRLSAERERLTALTAEMERARAREGIAAMAQAIRAELQGIEALATRITSTEKAIAALETVHEASKTALDEARKSRGERAAAVEAARERLRSAESGDAVRKRELEAAQLETSRSKLREERQKIDARLQQVEQLQRESSALDAVRIEISKLDAEEGQLRSAQAVAAAAEKTLEQDVRLAESLVAYGRWRSASESAEAAARARTASKQCADEALKKEFEARQHETQAAELAQKSTGLLAGAISDDQFETLQSLARQIEVAEAALGGGVTVSVRPRKELRLRTAVDGRPAVDAGLLKGEHILEAERAVQLEIDELVELEVAAGAPEQRRNATELKKKWSDTASPLLQKAGVTSLEQLKSNRATAKSLADAAKDATAKAQQAKIAAESLRERSRLLGGQTGPSAEDLATKEARIGQLPREALAELFKSMGSSWETQAEDLRAHKAEELSELRKGRTETDRKHAEKSAQLAEAKRREATAEAELKGRRLSLGDGDLETLAKQLRAAQATNTSEQQRLEALAATRTSEANSDLEAARHGVTAAEAALVDQGNLVTAAEAKVAQTSHQLGEQSGVARALRQQLQDANKGAVEQRLQSVEEKLAALGPETSVTIQLIEMTEAGIERLSAEYAEADQAYQQTEGALALGGGPMAAERLRQLDEAILEAQAREHERTIDADAWKLLRDTLREAEQVESAHLGNALAIPVGTGFSELTKGKYRSVVFDPNLKAQSVVMDGVHESGDIVLEALSVGTKDQLATLVRVAVAKQLKSALVLDDQLVHTDGQRLDWFGALLRTVAGDCQLLVFTCRPQDYLRSGDLPKEEAMKDSGAIRAIDLARVMTGAPRTTAP